jgi:hypothetical protein
VLVDSTGRLVLRGCEQGRELRFQRWRFVIGRDEDIFGLQRARHKNGNGHRLALFGWSGWHAQEKQGNQYQEVIMDRPFRTIKADFDYWLLGRDLYLIITINAAPSWKYNPDPEHAIEKRKRRKRMPRQRIQEKKPQVMKQVPAQGSFSDHPQ